ncbi:MAG: hypothetical protein GY778_15430, partial [bacterium]|nr:hypothetical protein [bacterium]
MIDYPEAFGLYSLDPVGRDSSPVEATPPAPPRPVEVRPPEVAVAVDAALIEEEFELGRAIEGQAAGQLEASRTSRSAMTEMADWIDACQPSSLNKTLRGVLLRMAEMADWIDACQTESIAERQASTR